MKFYAWIGVAKKRMSQVYLSMEGLKGRLKKGLKLARSIYKTRNQRHKKENTKGKIEEETRTKKTQEKFTKANFLGCSAANTLIMRKFRQIKNFQTEVVNPKTLTNKVSWLNQSISGRASFLERRRKTAYCKGKELNNQRKDSITMRMHMERNPQAILTWLPVLGFVVA